jgi:hypothetical protein
MKTTHRGGAKTLQGYANSKAESNKKASNWAWVMSMERFRTHGSWVKNGFLLLHLSNTWNTHRHTTKLLSLPNHSFIHNQTIALPSIDSCLLFSTIQTYKHTTKIIQTNQRCKPHEKKLQIEPVLPPTLISIHSLLLSQSLLLCLISKTILTTQQPNGVNRRLYACKTRTRTRRFTSFSGRIRFCLKRRPVQWYLVEFEPHSLLFGLGFVLDSISSLNRLRSGSCNLNSPPLSLLFLQPRIPSLSVSLIVALFTASREFAFELLLLWFRFCLCLAMYRFCLDQISYVCLLEQEEIALRFVWISEARIMELVNFLKVDDGD